MNILEYSTIVDICRGGIGGLDSGHGVLPEIHSDSLPLRPIVPLLKDDLALQQIGHQQPFLHFPSLHSYP